MRKKQIGDRLEKLCVKAWETEVLKCFCNFCTAKRGFVFTPINTLTTCESDTEQRRH